MPNEPGFVSPRRRLLLSTILAGGALATGGLTSGAHAQIVAPVPLPAPLPVPLPVPVPTFLPVPVPGPIPGNRVLPDVANAQAATSSGDANRAPVFQLAPPAGPGVQLNVVLRDKGTIINWGGTGFNIGTGARVDFADGFSANAGAREAIAVLNRDVNTMNNRSTITGSLTSSSDNISVYLINSNGILFGPGASVNTGSFVASTLDLDDADFFDGGANRFTGTGGAITVQGRANLRNSAANGSLALLAGSVDIQRDAVVNANGDLAIVAASDVSLTMEPGSPLSMTIARGTPVSNPLIVGGTVSGRDVYLAMATRDGVRDALLNVTGSVVATTVRPTSRGVVLAAGPGANAPGVTIAGPDTAGAAAIRITGSVLARRAVSAPSAVANVEIAASDDVTGGGAISASNLLNVVSGRDVNLTGATNAGTGARFSAARDVDVARATVASGDLRLDAARTVRLDDARLAAGAGDVALTGAARLTGASTISAGGAGSAVSFGGTLDGPGGLTVTAADTRFDGAVGGATRLADLTVNGLATLNAGAIRAGAIQLGALDIGAAAPADVVVDAGAGALAIDGATKAGSADANGLTLTGGSIAVRDVGVGGRFAAVIFDGDTTLTGDVAAAGAVRFADRLRLGAGIRRVNADSAEFGAVDAAGAAPATLSVDVTGAARFGAGVGGTRLIDLALRAGSTSFAATNQVGTLAARVATGGLSFVNDRSLAVGTVDGLAGVAADGGDVRISATGVGADIRLAAPVRASAGDVLLSAPRDVTGMAAGTVTASGRVELRAASSAIDLAGAVVAGGDIDATALGLVRLAALTATRDIRVVAGEGLTIAGPVAGRDVAIRAGGALVAGDLTAGDDVVVRAGGSATLGRIVGGTGSDAPGAGDLLSGTGTLVGGDVDVVAAELRIGSVRANGAGSDIRLSGGAAGIGDAAVDLDLRADGGILLTGPARGADIALSAGEGSVVTGGLVARDDIAVRAGGAIRLGDAASGATVDGQAAVERDGAADALAGVLAGNDIDLDADEIEVAAATANGTGGDLRIMASAGDLRLGTGQAGGAVVLTKRGSTGELQVTGSVRGGTASVSGDVLLTSDTSVRVAAASSATGAVSATAAGEVTGLGALGRADLRSEASGGDVSVHAGSLARLGTATAGRDLTVRAGTIDMLAGNARDISLEAGGAVAAGTLRARDDAAIRAAGAVTGDAVFAGVDGPVDEAGAADALAGAPLDGNDVDIRGASIALGRADANGGAASDLRLAAATGQLALGTGSAGGAATLGTAGADGELRVTGGLVAGGDARIESAGAARLAAVTSRAGAVSVIAAGEATGGALRADAGDVGVAGGPLVAFDTLSANGSLRAEAGAVRVGTGVAERGDLALRASAGELTLGAGSAGGTATLAKLGDAGALAVTGTLTAGGDVALASDTQARIGEAVSRAGDVRVTAVSEILGADGVGGATLRAGRDIVATGGALARLGVAEAGRDVSVTADAVEVADGSGRDIALRSRGGPVVLGTIRARDDIVVRAAGPVTATALRAGGEGAVDADGVADALAEWALAGNDIDVSGTSLDIGSVTATGSASDLRLAATQGRLRLGDADVGGAVDLLADGPDGELELAGALTFAGDASFTTTRDFRFGAIASRGGNLRVNAGGDVVGDRLASDAGDVIVDAGASASIGALAALRDGTVRAASVRVGTAVVGRDLLLAARSGPLTLDRGDAGGGATLIKDGLTGDLVVTQAVAAGTGDAVLTSSTNIRAGGARSAGGGVTIQAFNGDVTGIGDGRLDVSALGLGRDISVRAAGVARLGAVAAARDVVVAAGRIDLTSATGRDLALQASDTVAAGTLRARDDVAVRASGAVALGDAAAGAGVSEDGDGAADALVGSALAGNDLDAQGGALTVAAASAADEVRLTALTGSLAAGSVSSGGGVTLAKEGVDGTLAATGPITAGGDIAIRSATDVRVAGVTSGAGGVAIDAARDVRGGDLSAANGSVSVRAGSALALTGIAAGGDVSAAAGTVEIGSATATRGSLTLLARAGDLSIGSAAAGTGATLTKQGGAGELRVGGAITAGGDVALQSSTNIRVAGVASRGGAIVVDAAREARGAGLSAANGSVTLRAGSALAFGDVSAGAGVSGAADTVTIGAAVATRGALDLLARAGDLSIGSGSAGTGATLTKQGSTGELRVAGALEAGGDVAVRSATDVRVAGVTSRAGNLLVEAARNARGGDLSAAGGSIAMRAGSTLAFGTVAAGGDISGTADAVEIGAADATRGGLDLVARAGDLSLGGGTAATTIALTKQGATGELRVARALAAGGDVAVRSATDIRVAGVTSRAGNLLVDATRNVRGDALSTPNGSITARAGSALAFDTLGAGAGITGAADAVTVGTAAATRGGLDLLARAGDLSLGRGAAGTTATLTKQGATGQLRVSDSLAAGGNVNATSSTDVRLANAASDTGRLVVSAAGDVTGAAPPAAGFGGANLQATRGGIAVTAGGAIAQLGTVAAGPALDIRANDLELLGATSAERVEIVNGGARGGTRLGDDLAPAAGLNLRVAELDRITANSLVVQGGARDMEVGTLAFGARTGSGSIALLTTGRVDVTGAVSAAGAPNAPLRSVRIGGDAGDGLATTLRVASTSTGGGRLAFANTALDLRAARIGVGQDLLFLDTIGLAPGGTPLPVSAVTARYISNPSSTLYVAARPYALTDGQPAALIGASTLSLRFTDYALVQNTAASAATPAGIAVGGAGVPAPFLTLGAGGDTGANAVALFGTINGFGGQQAALLGPDAIALNGINRANSRINGCPVGAGGEGCLAANVFTTTTTEPEEEDEVVITVADEQPLALDAPVGASNEALIIGVGAADRQGQPVAADQGAGGARPL